MNKYIVILVIVLGGVVLLSQGTQNQNDFQETKENEEVVEVTNILDGKQAIVYKGPFCGCCVAFSSLIEKEGVNVEIVEETDMQSIKDKYLIPREMESCHTTVIDSYFFEGHVPFEVIEKVLKEKPDIDGIALPNMPAGTPGMPGVKTGTYHIYQIKDGVASIYVSL